MHTKRALLSVADKTGILLLAQGLHDAGFEIYSTGGTAKVLQDADLPIHEVSQLTNFPEIMGGRLKTLHPAVFGGILSRRSGEDQEVLAEHGFQHLDMVVVNLYPFEEAVSRPGVSWEEAIESIDVGGVALLRAAAKNHQHVTVVCDPGDYALVLGSIHEKGEVPPDVRRFLASEAFQHTSRYDAIISGWMEEAIYPGEINFPKEQVIGLVHKEELRYGENPHQKGALYTRQRPPVPSMMSARQLSGQACSYNNYIDGNAAINLLLEFDEPTAVAIKHTAPCAVASAESIAKAFAKCSAADPLSIYGGVVALNRPLDVETAALLRPIYIVMILAPSFDSAAIELLEDKRSIILMELGPKETWSKENEVLLRSIRGGFLLQSPDNSTSDLSSWQTVSEAQLSEDCLADVDYAWRVVKHMPSNAIVVVKNKVTLGLGQGQVSRVEAARQALKQAGEAAIGAVLASDGFIPFGDTMYEAGSYGISTVVEPGGSLRDDVCIQVANELGLTLVFTGVRHFRH